MTTLLWNWCSRLDRILPSLWAGCDSILGERVETFHHCEQDVFPPGWNCAFLTSRSDISAEPFHRWYLMCLSWWWMWVLRLSNEQVRCKCWAKTYLVARPTTNMKKGWLCRTSHDKIVHTWWWPKEIQIELWSRSSYDDSERSRSSDDPDPAIVIQIEWWSRSSPVMMIQIERWSRSSPVMMIQIERWSRSRWLEDEDDLKTKMIMLIQRRRPVLKIVSKEYLPS